MSSSDSRLTRRTLARRGAAMTMAWTLARALGPIEAIASPIQSPDDPRPILNRFPRMVQEFYVDRLRAFDAARNRALRALRTREDAERHVASVRERIAESFGPMPERTPLNPRVTETLERDGYRIEHVIFESRPGFLVSANLYVPTNRGEGRLPGVVGSCGHSVEGKAGGTYQAFAQGLARQGYVCLIFDPIGQGERLQYLDDDLKPKFGTGTSEHLRAGNQQMLVGEFFGTWRAWDVIRALDYLLTREEVDPARVGITGNSGGGTMTTWLCGLEPRWTMGAPSCFVTSFRRNLENELPADIEQCPPRALELGLDHEDFLAAMAPKPVIILAKERDYFDVRGSIAAHRRLKALYTLLGAPENIGLFVGPTPHGFSQENREAMYGWFNRVTGVADGSSEPALTMEEEETLHCSPDGQVGPMGSKSVFAFTKEASERLAESRGELDPEQTRAAVLAAMRLPERRPLPPYRILRPISGRGYPTSHAGNYAVPTEPGIDVLVYRLFDRSHVSRPPADTPRAILYVSDKSADEELRDEPMIRELMEAEAESAVYACDLRGIGESRPNTCGINSYFNPYGNDYFYAAHGIMLGRPVPTQRTLDLLRVLDWLRAIGHTEVHLSSRGWGAIPATFAALLDEGDTIKAVTLKHALTSFADVAGSEDYDWPLSTFLPGVLTSFDLPDCYRALEARNLRQIEPRGAKAEG